MAPVPSRRSNRLGIYFHLHLISDATGETLNAVAKAAMAQFDTGVPITHSYALVRTERHLARVLDQVANAPGIVIYTLVNDALRMQLEEYCAARGINCLSLLDPVISMIGNYLGAETTHRPGGQHALDEEYFERIAALQYTMAHDDGQLGDDLAEADVVLAGVSRTSKTPTCVYLANRGLKAANIPIVLGTPQIAALENLRGPLIVGLTTSPDLLVDIRRNRMRSIDQPQDSQYTDPEKVAEEIRFARRFFSRHGWPVIDVTRRSVEETAAAILNLLTERDAS
ncbi:MAG TPA: phosphoenolpyruvate synthase regulatory protein [Alphaproteobacteria bacterium]|jgi:regulator of PEP synthase PpsR (kinase-PPPase family)|nr:phosphoenolpyruvate synthase regulatory protein [Alphaproteobacteria bacterium]HBA42022.1 phosphoenolpyruvate synthase regulatory protein [Alphaproteobacteria bacterium]HBC53809.1 phosphoenolpyruvate synthase regulatory protein [Alphaproteobacteria bacterium]HBF99137.1 phosphoenolpyruvate synthase regulatory protein [Alphaproteobacteria bacterium]HCO92308.1 phosphoenolpyruvate synthase regulatory protein [Alphaproteobacteria bacterium]